MANYFRGSTEKNAVLYRCGEIIRFNLELVHDGEPITCPLFKWELYGDDGKNSSGMASGETGKFSIDTTLDRDGFVRLIVTACEADGKPLEGFDKFEGGAGAEIEKIEQGVEDPEDFDAFWDEQVKLVNSVEPEVLEKVRVHEENPDFEIYDMKLKAPGPMPVSGYLTIPKGAAPGTLRARLSFMGYGVSSAPINCEKGSIWFSVNIHGVENGHEQAYYDNLRATTYAGFAFDREENREPETCYFRYVILRDLQAARWLKTLPEYDGKGLTISGGSMGAFQSVSVAAHDRDAAKLIIGIPWMCDLGAITKGRMRGWRPEFDKAMRYYDTAAQASRVTCPVEISCGLGDYVCPPSGQVVLWHNFKGEKKITFIQNKTHPYTPPEITSYTL